MTERLKRLLSGETFRYLVCGALTVAVNIVSYKLLVLIWTSLTANTAAFFIAVVFAYWTNGTFVFRSPLGPKSFAQFMGMRLGTLAVDDGGMWALLALGVDDLLAKCVVNAVIIVINYLASKLIIFKKREERGESS